MGMLVMFDAQIANLNLVHSLEFISIQFVSVQKGITSMYTFTPINAFTAINVAKNIRNQCRSTYFHIGKQCMKQNMQHKKVLVKRLGEERWTVDKSTSSATSSINQVYHDLSCVE